jgi:hypothetical protein
MFFTLLRIPSVLEILFCNNLMLYAHFVLYRRVWPKESRLKSVLLTLLSQHIARLHAGLAGDNQSCDISANAMHLHAATRASPTFVFTTAESVTKWTGCQNTPYNYVAISPSGAPRASRGARTPRKTLALWPWGICPL